MCKLLNEKSFLFAALLLSAISMSCSKDPDETDKPNKPDDHNIIEWGDSTLSGDAVMGEKMMFRVGDSLQVIRKASTRLSTAFDGQNYTLSGDDRITIAMKRGSESEVIKIYKVKDADTGALEYEKDADGNKTEPFYWKSTTETVKLRAWSYGTSEAYTSDPLTTPFTLNTIQTELAVGKDNYRELLYDKQRDYPYAANITLNLYHQLARITVELTNSATSDLSIATNGVTIGGGVLPTSAQFVAPTGDSNIGSWDDLSNTGTVIARVDNATEKKYSAVVFPKTYSAGTKIVGVTTTAESPWNSYAYTLPSGGEELEAGKQYSYKVNVRDLVLVSSLTVSDIAAVTYNGSAQTPEPTVTDPVSGKVLTKGTHYILEYDNNINAGTAICKVIGQGIYSGTQSKNFTINKKAATITLSQASILVADVSSDTFVATLSESESSTTITATTGNSTYYASSAGSLSSSKSIVTIVGQTDGIADCTISANSDNYSYTDVTCSVEIRAQKKNPLWWINKANEATATNSYTSRTIGGKTEYYYNWFKAMQTWSNSQTPRTAWTAGNKTSTVSGATGTWHMGVLGEWNSVLPYQNIFALTYTSGKCAPSFSSDNYKYCFGYDPSSKTLKSETSRFVQVNGSNSKVAYAIRFIGTDYCSAWKWVIQDNGASESSPRKILIYSMLITKLADISAADSWSTSSNWQTVENIWNLMDENSDNGLACRRSLVCAGWPYGGEYGAVGYYWPATGTQDGSSVYPISIRFNGSGLSNYQTNWNQTEGRSVRTFHD